MKGTHYIILGILTYLMDQRKNQIKIIQRLTLITLSTILFKGT